MIELFVLVAVLATVVGSVWLYFQALKWFLMGWAPMLVMVGGGLVSVLVLILYLVTAARVLLGKAGPPDSPVGPEPAFKAYFFRKWWTDYQAIVSQSSHANSRLLSTVLSVAGTLMRGGTVAGSTSSPSGWALVTAPVGLVAYAVGGLAGLAMVVAVLAFGLLHFLAVVPFVGLAAMATVVFRWLEHLSMAARRIFLVCPHGQCYQRISLPVYLCPHCGQSHKRLIPGTYGTFQRRCQCGHWLPTLFLFGRNQLPSQCPACCRPITFTLQRNLHLPVVGGPSAGKSHYLMASMVELDFRRQQGKLGLNFPEPAHQALFASCRADFQAGTPLIKTMSKSPDAFLADLTDPTGHRGAVYCYDAAGELFQDWEELRRHPYYGYIHGLIFLVDPFSLPQVRLDRGPEILAQTHLQPSDESPQDVYTRVVGILRTCVGGRGRLNRHPCAVVLTKMDALGLETEVGGKVRAWLQNHEADDLVRAIELDFSRVEYFACSSLGRSPDGGSDPFTPRGVLSPLHWLLGHYGFNLEGETRPWAGVVQKFHRLGSTLQVLSSENRHNQALGLVSIAPGAVAFWYHSLSYFLASLLLALLAFQTARLRLGDGAWAAVLSLFLLGIQGGGSSLMAARERARWAESERLVGQAEERLRNGDLQQAEKLFIQAQTAHSRHPRPLTGLREVRELQYQHLLTKAESAPAAQARQLFAEALQQRPGDERARVGLVRARRSDPESLMRAYYDAIGRQDLDEAYGYLVGPDIARESFVRAWAGLPQPQLEEFEIERRASQSAYAYERVRTAKGRYESRFQLMMTQDGWGIGHTQWLRGPSGVLGKRLAVARGGPRTEAMAPDSSEEPTPSSATNSSKPEKPSTASTRPVQPPVERHPRLVVAAPRPQPRVPEAPPPQPPLPEAPRPRLPVAAAPRPRPAPSRPRPVEVPLPIMTPVAPEPDVFMTPEP